MSVSEIQVAISRLPTHELAELMAWLQHHHQDTWDRQLADDLEAGRLDKLLAEVDEEYEAGNARPL